MCYFPAGNGEAEVKDNNKSVEECRIWKMGKVRREKKINSTQTEKVSGRRRHKAV